MASAAAAASSSSELGGGPGSGPAPATWGVCHGRKWLGSAIREAELLASNDRQASWAGHAFVAIGDRDFGRGPEPAIVQAEWPRVVCSPAASHPDAIWATGQLLTWNQRQAGQAAALSLLGHWYDLLSYPYFVARLLHLTLTDDLASFLDAGNRLGAIICSGVVVRVLQSMGVSLDSARAAAVPDPDFISPADLLRWGLRNGWMSNVPPASW